MASTRCRNGEHGEEPDRVDACASVAGQQAAAVAVSPSYAGSGGKEACLHVGPNLSAARAVVDGGFPARSAGNLYCCGTGSLSPGGTGGGLLKISSWAVEQLRNSALARPMTGLERGSAWPTTAPVITKAFAPFL